VSVSLNGLVPVGDVDPASLGGDDELLLHATKTKQSAAPAYAPVAQTVLPAMSSLLVNEW
jgi:hypothetical protein